MFYTVFCILKSACVSENLLQFCTLYTWIFGNFSRCRFLLFDSCSSCRLHVEIILMHDIFVLNSPLALLHMIGIVNSAIVMFVTHLLHVFTGAPASPVLTIVMLLIKTSSGRPRGKVQRNMMKLHLWHLWFLILLFL